MIKGQITFTSLEIFLNNTSTPSNFSNTSISPHFIHFNSFVNVRFNFSHFCLFVFVFSFTDGSLKANLASCGGIFRDHRGTFLGAFASNLGVVSVFEAELTGILIVMEYAASHLWHLLWIECDSTSPVQAFKNVDIIPFRLRNRWHNCLQKGICALCSHVYREGNYCVDILADFGHSISGTVWLDSLPQSLSADFFRNRMGLPNYWFP